MKKKKIRRVIFMILIMIILIGLISILGLYMFEDHNKITKIKVVNEIEKYNYKLEENETKLYKDLFKQLKTELSKKDIDEESYAKLIAQLFIADFYNLDNKLSKNDIGGIQYIHTNIKDNFILNAENTLYKYIQNNMYGDRKQELPIVTEVTVSNIETNTYEYNKQEDPKAYQLTLNWQYKKDLGYQKDAIMIIIHEKDKLSIVELKNINNKND